MLLLLLLSLLRSCKVGIVDGGEAKRGVVLTLPLTGFDKPDWVRQKRVEHAPLLQGCTKLIRTRGKDLLCELFPLFFGWRVGQGADGGCLFVVAIELLGGTGIGERVGSVHALLLRRLVIGA